MFSLSLSLPSVNGEQVFTSRSCSLLMVNVSPAQEMAQVKKYARDVHVELLFVPARATGRFPLLDRGTFDESMSRARVELNPLSTITGKHGVGYHILLRVFSTSWMQHAPRICHVVGSASNKYAQ
jgi:hypothetical protein